MPLMYAPSAYAIFVAQSGTRYTANAEAQIASVAVNDVVDLLQGGCTLVAAGDAALNKLNGTVDPTANEDADDGYSVGSTWLNITGGKVWVCLDATAAAAVWVQNGPGTGTFGDRLNLTSGRTATGLVLDATGGAGLFKIAMTPATSLKLAGETANSNTKTDTVYFEYTLPKTYVAAAALSVIVNANIVIGAGTAGTKTCTVLAYEIATDGSAGSNLGPVAQNLGNTAADLTFALTATTLSPGDKLLIGITIALQETAASNINANINSVRLA